MMGSTPGKDRRTATSPERKREIARMGAYALHAQNKAHKWTSEEAQAAGRIGGTISRRGGVPLTQEEIAARRAIIEGGQEA